MIVNLEHVRPDGVKEKCSFEAEAQHTRNGRHGDDFPLSWNLDGRKVIVADDSWYLVKEDTQAECVEVK